MQSNQHEGNDNYKVLKHRKYRITWLSWIEWNPESKNQAQQRKIQGTLIKFHQLGQSQ